MKPTSTQRNKWSMDRVITFDIEAYDWVKPVALGYYDGDSYDDYLGSDCIDSFMQEVMRRKYRNTRFVAHNGGNYDFGFIIEWCLEQDYDYHFLEKNGSVFYIKVYDDSGKPRYFQDSLDLLMSSLQKVAGEFTEYEKLDFDVDRIEPLGQMDSETIREMREYLKVDCKALFDSLKEFTKIVEDISGGDCKPQLTMGSTTMSMFKSKFMKDAIPQSWEPPTDDDMSHKEVMHDYYQSIEHDIRQSYYGGRTEVYKMYGEDLNHYDVNSLFPYCYTEKKMPVGKPRKTTDSDVLSNTDMGGCVKIQGHVPDVKIPVLPVRYKADTYEKVCFPTGDIGGWYMLSEIRYAKEVGALENISVLDGYVSRYGKPFEEYGRRMYSKKQAIDKEANPARYWVVKLLLNSFYGKFALDREQENYVHCEDPLTYMNEKDTPLIPINKKMEQQRLFKEPDVSEADYIIPRIASEVTAKARIEMHKWFRKAGYDNVWYCDTDSIVTDSELPTGEALGELDLENTVSRGYFLAPKVYAELTHDGNARTKAKGMRDNPNPFMAFEKAYKDKIPEIISAEWNTPKGVVPAITKNGGMTVDNQSRTLQKFDDKRNHTGDADSEPITVSMV